MQEPEFIGGDVDLRINIYRSQKAVNSAMNNATMNTRGTVSGTGMLDTVGKVLDSADKMPDAVGNVPDNSQERQIFKYVLERGGNLTAWEIIYVEH